MRDAAHAQYGALDCGGVFESLQAESRKREEVIGLMEQGRRDEAVRRTMEKAVPKRGDDEEDPSFWRGGDGDDEMDTMTRIGEPMDDLESMPEEPEELKDAAHEASREDPLHGDGHEVPVDCKSAVESRAAASRGAGESPKVATTKPPHNQDARDKKFEALDSELAQWLDDFGGEDSPPKLPLAARV